MEKIDSSPGLAQVERRNRTNHDYEVLIMSSGEICLPVVSGLACHGRATHPLPRSIGSSQPCLPFPHTTQRGLASIGCAQLWLGMLKDGQLMQPQHYQYP